MKVKVIFNGKSKPLTVDINIFDTVVRKDSVGTPEEFRTWINNSAGNFISLGKKVINLKNVEYFEILK